MPKHLKDIDDSENIIHHFDMIDFCRKLYSTTGEYTSFSGTLVVFIKKWNNKVRGEINEIENGQMKEKNQWNSKLYLQKDQ